MVDLNRAEGGPQVPSGETVPLEKDRHLSSDAAITLLCPLGHSRVLHRYTPDLTQSNQSTAFGYSVLNVHVLAQILREILVFLNCAGAQGTTQ